MNTSYFNKSGNLPNVISIAAKSPSWFTGKKYKKLAPKFWFFQEYKENGDELFYVENYCREVLNKLNAKDVYDELGKDSILVCWETSDKFCHRHIIAAWFKEELNIDVIEI